MRISSSPQRYRRNEMLEGAKCTDSPTSGKASKISFVESCPAFLRNLWAWKGADPAEVKANLL
jgi:hypothetical protein